MYQREQEYVCVCVCVRGLQCTSVHTGMRACFVSKCSFDVGRKFPLGVQCACPHIFRVAEDVTIES